MRRKVLLLSLSGLLAQTAQAACLWDPEFDPPLTLTIPSQLITVSADEPADTSRPIASYDSNPSTSKISYIHCLAGEMYGKRPIGLTSQNSTTKIYSTNILGIGVKLLWNNGISPAFGNFPSDAKMTFPDGKDEQEGRYNWDPGSFYRIEFYKTADILKLTNAAGTQVLPAGDLAYNYVALPSPTSYVQKLRTGRITIVSTPACTTESTKTVDFGTVTAAMLATSPVERDLDFQIICKTDYGSYSTTAGISTTTPSSDAKYIRVTDAAGQTEQLGIEIYNNQGVLLSVDGSSLENTYNVNSMAPTEFKWKTKLFSTGKGTKQPRGGPFTAHAEILLQVN